MIRTLLAALLLAGCGHVRAPQTRTCAESVYTMASGVTCQPGAVVVVEDVGGELVMICACGR